MSLQRFALLAAFLAVAGTASASTLFSDNFNTATPHANYTTGTGNPIPTGSGFKVTAGTVDVLGDIGGSFFTCNAEVNNNCVDLVGGSLGTIQTTATFNLVAGNTYSLTFRSVASGPFGSFTFNSQASLGSQSLNFSDVQTSSTGYLWTNRTLQFIAAANENSVRITFQALNSFNSNLNGALVDDVVLTETAPVNNTPEPSTALLGSAGLLAMLAIARLRNR